MYIISFNEVIELNQVLEAKELGYRIHLRDACGGQSIWIETLSECMTEGKDEVAKQLIQHFFERKGAKIQFIGSGLEFKVE